MQQDMIYDRPVSDIHVDARRTFIKRTYIHLLGAGVLFTMLEVFYFKSGLAFTMANAMLGTSWLLVLGLFIGASWVASRFAYQATSLGGQYFGLGLFVLAESIIFVPLLFMAMMKSPQIIESAAQVTLIGFGALTAIAFLSGKDFSFLGGLLKWLMIMSLVLIVGSLIFGFNLGIVFSVAMVALAGGYILYDTSNIIRHFPEDRYVGAALALFASVAMMFWYVIRIFMSRD